MAAQPWNDAYVFFKHDYIDGAGPLAVERFVGMVGTVPPVRAVNACLSPVVPTRGLIVPIAQGTAHAYARRRPVARLAGTAVSDRFTEIGVNPISSRKR